jgi:hypothetical protein
MHVCAGGPGSVTLFFGQVHDSPKEKIVKTLVIVLMVLLAGLKIVSVIRNAFDGVQSRYTQSLVHALSER